jgi:hypothetical protein
LGIPILGVAFGGSLGRVAALFLFGAVGLMLAAACLVMAWQRQWSASTRGWGIAWTSFVGYVMLGIMLRVAGGDSPVVTSTIPGPWCWLAPLDNGGGGFRVEMPGLPQKAVGSAMVTVPFPLNEVVYAADVVPARTGFVVAYGNSRDAVPAEQKLQTLARNFANQNNGTIVNQREAEVDGKKGIAFEINSRDRGTIAVRACFHEGRLFALAFGSRQLPVTCAEATRFFDSFAFDATTGWPPKPPGVGRADPRVPTAVARAGRE